MSKSYLPIQHFEAKQLSVNLLDSPEDFYMHNRRYSSSVIMQIIYGRRIPQCTCPLHPNSLPSTSDPLELYSSFIVFLQIGDCEDIRRIYGVLARFSSFRRPGTFLVETFPSLANSRIFNYLSNWREIGKQIQKKDEEVYGTFWNDLKRQIQDGTAPHSWGKAFVLSNYKKQGMDELGAIYTAYDPNFQKQFCLTIFF